MNSLATAFSAAFTFTKAPGIPHSVAVLLLALLCVALAGQTVHAGFLMMQTNRRTTRWHRVFELCMIVSLLVSALFLFSVAQMRHTLVAHFGSIALSLWPLLWMHAITFAAGIGAAIAQKRPSL